MSDLYKALSNGLPAKPKSRLAKSLAGTSVSDYVADMLDLQDAQYRASMLPLIKDEQGNPSLGYPQFAIDAIEAFMLPGHVARGGSYTPQDVSEMALDVGMIAAPVGMAAAPKGAIAMGGSKKGLGSMADDVVEPATRKQNFENWFGGSKAVDEAGDPLTVYHGTHSDISAFSPEKIGAKHPTYSFGYHFSDSPVESAIYSKGAGGNTIPVNLKIKNPLRVKTGDYASNYIDNNKRELIEKIIKSKKDKKIIDDDSLLNALFNDGEVLEKIIPANPYDGIIVQGKNDTNYVVFEPTQIKSIHNRGTYDPTDPNILNMNSPLSAILGAMREREQ